MRLICLLQSGDYTPGDPPPDGYGARIEWARVQIKAGLRQTQCRGCHRWYFPQEEEEHTCHMV